MVFHILLSTIKAARAFPNPSSSITSISVPPFVSTILPRNVKDCASSRISHCTVIGLVLLFIFVTLVLPSFIFSPNVATVVPVSGVISCIRFWLCEEKNEPHHRQIKGHLIVPSVYSVHCMPFCFPSAAVLMVQSIATRKRNGESMQPCLTPISTSNVSMILPSGRTLPVIPLYVVLIIEMNVSGIP